ncbi:MAG: RNA chaperone Hfq [Gammaproteobacteria bacterium]|jgi:host factor-I protein|nr:RNA chaperone Hfq [Gammaproteobacteria bacterium]
MSNEASHSEENFINKLIAAKTPVSVFMRNGIKLTGILVAADEEVLYLKNTITQMVYKHAVSTIVPASNVE